MKAKVELGLKKIPIGLFHFFERHSCRFLEFNIKFNGTKQIWFSQNTTKVIAVTKITRLTDIAETWTGHSEQWESTPMHALSRTTLPDHM